MYGSMTNVGNRTVAWHKMHVLDSGEGAVSLAVR